MESCLLLTHQVIFLVIPKNKAFLLMILIFSETTLSFRPNLILAFIFKWQDLEIFLLCFCSHYQLNPTKSS